MKRVLKIILVVLLSVLTLGGAYFLGKTMANDKQVPEDVPPVELPEVDDSNGAVFADAEAGYMHADKEMEDNLTVMLSSIKEEEYDLMGIPETAESCISVQAYVLQRGHFFSVSASCTPHFIQYMPFTSHSGCFLP